MCELAGVSAVVSLNSSLLFLSMSFRVLRSGKASGFVKIKYEVQWSVGIITCSSTKTCCSGLVSEWLYVYWEKKGGGYLEVFGSVSMIWVIYIFSGGSGFGWEGTIGKFSFKSSIGTVSTG